MIEIEDWGLSRYADSWDRQKSIFDGMVKEKRQGRSPEREYLVMTEHYPVVTMGRHAETANLLMPETEMNRRGVECYRIERGGDVTFHGPGQLVVYPLIDMEAHHLGVKDYVSLLEDTVISTIGHYGIKGEKIDGATGVWIGKGSERERKICAIGIKCSRHCTMHGLALNVNTDLSYFSLINPCGFVDKGVTSISQELGREVPMKEVKELFSRLFISRILLL